MTPAILREALLSNSRRDLRDQISAQVSKCNCLPGSGCRGAADDARLSPRQIVGSLGRSQVHFGAGLTQSRGQDHG